MSGSWRHCAGRPQGVPGSAETAVREHVRRLAPLAGAAERERLVGAAVARLDGLGPLDALIRDVAVDEVLVNGGGEVWVERAGELERRGWIAATDLAVVIERILAPLGRRSRSHDTDRRCPPRRRHTGVRRRAADQR